MNSKKNPNSLRNIFGALVVGIALTAIFFGGVIFGTENPGPKPVIGYIGLGLFLIVGIILLSNKDKKEGK